VGGAEVVNYLHSTYPEWKRDYDPSTNHREAVATVAEDLSKDCGLDIYAESIWIAGGCVSLGMVFAGFSMGDDVRTPEDDEKLDKLERRLLELRFSASPKLQTLAIARFGVAIPVD
jgi:hypothetical protein